MPSILNTCPSACLTKSPLLKPGYIDNRLSCAENKSDRRQLTMAMQSTSDRRQLTHDGHAEQKWQTTNTLTMAMHFNSELNITFWRAKFDNTSRQQHHIRRNHTNIVRKLRSACSRPPSIIHCDTRHELLHKRVHTQTLDAASGYMQNNTSMSWTAETAEVHRLVRNPMDYYG